MSKYELQVAILKSAIAVCENAAYLPDGNAQITSSIIHEFEEAFSRLSEYEEEDYKEHFIRPDQINLNAAQVALQRLGMSEDQLAIERALDAADRLALSIFDEVIIPGFSYLIKAKRNEGEVRYASKEAIDEFMAIVQQVKFAN